VSVACQLSPVGRVRWTFCRVHVIENDTLGGLVFDTRKQRVSTQTQTTDGSLDVRCGSRLVVYMTRDAPNRGMWYDPCTCYARRRRCFASMCSGNMALLVQYVDDVCADALSIRTPLPRCAGWEIMKSCRDAPRWLKNNAWYSLRGPRKCGDIARVRTEPVWTAAFCRGDEKLKRGEFRSCSCC
jgi:hypothetical protein